MSYKLESGADTRGAVSVRVNSNENTDAPSAETWLDFDTRWLDDGWHHVAVTWEYETGQTRRAAAPAAAAAAAA